MKKSFTLLLAICVIAILCGCNRNATSDSKALSNEPTDDDLLKGTWEVTSATINGDSFPVEGQTDIHIGGRYQFDGETLTKFPNPEFPGVSKAGILHRYQIDEKTKPKQIEIQMQGENRNGPWPPEIIIYRLEKDSYFCAGRSSVKPYRKHLNPSLAKISACTNFGVSKNRLS